MKLLQFIEYLRNHLKAVVKVCLAVLAVLIVIDAIIVNKGHAHTGFEKWPAFWAVFGFAGCVILIILSKWFGRAGIMQREDYYEDNDE